MTARELKEPPMDVGVFFFPADFAMPVADLGRAMEERGFESLLFPEHTHIPSSRRTPWPSGMPLPPEYWHSIDPFAACNVVAAVTTRLKVGTGICLLAQRDPIVTAKEISSVDYLSGGRFLFGVGGGWNREEAEHHGIRFEDRWKILRERIAAMKAIWTQDEASFSGEFVRFEPLWQWPKPVQKPYPPILVGGNGPHTLQRVVEYGDEWMPVVGREGPPFEPRVADLQRLAQEQGRAPIPVTAFGAPRDRAVLETYREFNVHRVVFHLPSVGADEALPLLDQFADLAARIR
jgi:probable F420-dependent oxidoreductase